MFRKRTMDWVQEENSLIDGQYNIQQLLSIQLLPDAPHEVLGYSRIMAITILDLNLQSNTEEFDGEMRSLE